MIPALPTLGVDPGRTGAACLLATDGRTVLRWWTWQHRVRKAGDVYVTEGSSDHGAYTYLYSLHDVASAISDELDGVLPGSLRLVVEGLFVPRGRTNGVMSLGEITGELMGPLRVHAVGDVLRPTAGTWRPAVLGISPTTRAEPAEQEALRVVRAGLVRGLEDVVSPHLAEAACLARWGWMQQQTEVR